MQELTRARYAHSNIINLIWDDMSEADKKRYLREVKSGSSKGINSTDAPAYLDLLENKIRIIDFGVEKTKDFIERGMYLGLFNDDSYADFRTMIKSDDSINCAYIITNGSKKINRNVEGKRDVYFLSGWSDSYHYHTWTGINALCTFGHTPEIAHDKIIEVSKDLIPDKDAAIKRFEMRRLVRGGD